MRKLNKSILMILFLMIVSAGLASGAEPVKIGIVWPMTGVSAAAGTYLVAGAEMWRDKVNAEGGILGRPVKFFIEDGALDPAISVSAAEKLITREKVDLFVGCMGSSPTMAVSTSVTRKYGIPHMVEVAGADKITEENGKRPNPWLFRISATNRMEADLLQEFIPKMGFSKMALMPMNTDWGRGWADVFPKVAEKVGGKIVAVEFLNNDATDFLTQLTKIRASGADSIVISTDGAQAAMVLKQYKQMGMTQKVITTGGGIVPELLVDLSGAPAAEGVYINTFFTPWFPELTKIPQEAKWFVEEYKKRGHPVKGFGTCYRGYDALKAAKAAVDIAKTLDKEKVRDAFAKVDTWGLSGRIKFDEFGQSTPSMYIVQVKSGKPTIPDFMKK
jgi:branched-chain amino acid transport system substrate-binding protein